MGRLLLMRHAKSSWSKPGLSDHDRPLNDRGLRDAPRMGAWLEEQGLRPDRILSSTALRARTTAELVAGTWESPPGIHLYRELYLSTPQTMLETIMSECREEGCLMLVAHNPGIEDFIHETTSRLEECPTGVIASLSFERSWRDILEYPTAALDDIWRPKELLDSQSR